jgi:hypothetical protein
MMKRISGASFARVSRDDDTDGVIVGAYNLAGRLYYQDRPQSQQFYAATEQDLQLMATDQKRELLADNPGIYKTDGWELRIFQ